MSLCQYWPFFTTQGPHFWRLKCNLRPAFSAFWAAAQQTNKNAALFIVYERARPNGETPSDSRSRLHLTKNGGKKVAACFFPTAWMRIMTLHLKGNSCCCLPTLQFIPNGHQAIKNLGVTLKRNGFSKVKWPFLNWKQTEFRQAWDIFI